MARVIIVCCLLLQHFLLLKHLQTEIRCSPMAMRRWWWRGEIYLSMVEKSIFTCKRLSGLFDLFGVFWRCHAIDLVFDERPKEDQLRQLSSCGCGRLIRNVSGATNSGWCKLKYKY